MSKSRENEGKGVLFVCGPITGTLRKTSNQVLSPHPTTHFWEEGDIFFSFGLDHTAPQTQIPALGWSPAAPSKANSNDVPHPTPHTIRVFSCSAE